MLKNVYLLLVQFIFQNVICNNIPPIFEKDLNNEIVLENSPIGYEVGTLKGSGENTLIYGIEGTDLFSVDQKTGVLRVTKALDREINDSVRFNITLEEESDDGESNKIYVPITLIIDDVNDNAPRFVQTPYKISVAEDTPLGTTIFKNIVVRDDDLIGDPLEVFCDTERSKDCEKFNIVRLNNNASIYEGCIVLNSTLNYNEKETYEFFLNTNDGEPDHTSSTLCEVRVTDVQNSPPVFQSSLTAVVLEDAPIGTLVLTIQAKDGDRGVPRPIQYNLVSNPHGFLSINPVSGELQTAKPLDREILSDSNGVLLLTVKAREVVNGQPSDEKDSSITADISVTIKDVNDEAPEFNRREYFVTIPENIPLGSPLPNLDMTVTDKDIGNNSVFSLRLEDVSGAFAVEPTSAVGSTSVIIRLINGSLDYENLNQRKFIILVIAEEMNTNKPLSSTSTITVVVSDVNDNAPHFERATYMANVLESALPGTIVTNITANDLDSDVNGKSSIVYELFGEGADKFNVDRKTGVITVALCTHPGTAPCLDYETTPTYFLTYKASDKEGQGFSASVLLKIMLLDSNDNPPMFTSKNYSAVIDEGDTKFEPPFFVKAEDADKTSVVRYFISDAHVNGLFDIDSLSGEIRIVADKGIMRSADFGMIAFNVNASDGLYFSEASVYIQILDVNNNIPQFLLSTYTTSVAEDSEKGKPVIKVVAIDNDSDINAKLTYRIEKGSFEDFNIDGDTGLIKVASKLDYDRKKQYNITVTATDGGTPMLTGTTLVQINILNTNDKDPYFEPSLQKAEVPKDAKQGVIFYKMVANDPDINDTNALNYEFDEPITAVDKNGKEVNDNDEYKKFFDVNKNTGEVFVANLLNREIAAVIRLSVVVTDTSATYKQQGKGLLMVTILDVNDIPPSFTEPWTTDDPNYYMLMAEEMPIDSILSTFTAIDPDSDIDRYEIHPDSEYFYINETNGTVYIKKRIDYEENIRVLNFTVRAYDKGKPQLFTEAHVIINVININDNGPIFEKSEYFATIKENSPKDTFVINVTATDLDEDDFGAIKYALKGDYSNDFIIDKQTGEIKVSNPGALDREKVDEILLKVEATDYAPKDEAKSAVVPVHIKIEDVNDNAPIFMQHHYSANIVETIPYSPPSPIVQLHAEDRDETSHLRYHIVNGNDDEVFLLETSSGILYPKRSLLGFLKQFKLTVEVTDGKFSDRAVVDVNVLDVNQNKPFFKEPSSMNASVLIPENVEVNHLVMKVFAEDKDPGENGRVTYHFRVGNNDSQVTDEFSINENNGELRTLVGLDREKRTSYQLILVAKDHGTQITYETLQFLTIILKDIDDNKPMFVPNEDGNSEYVFTVNENNPHNFLIGKIQAEDADEGDNAKVYYYVIRGNEDGMFKLDRRDGSIYALGVLDKERNSSLEFYVKATNNPNYNSAANEIIAKGDPTIAHIQINVKDENDNAPQFTRSVYYAGIDAKATIGEYVTDVKAEDPDEGVNGEIQYEIGASHLFKSGSNHSSGSLIPSPFVISAQGKITTADFVTVYNQDRFELHIIARENAPPNRQSTTIVNVWVYESQQLARVILSRPPQEVKSEVHKIVAELSNATGNVVVVDDVRYHRNANGQIQHNWCDMYMHMINSDTQTIVTIPDVLKIIDAKYEDLKTYYAGFAIENVLPAYVEKAEEPFEPALAALVALTIVLFVGCASVLVLCCCFRHWVIMEPLDMKCDMLIKKPIIDDLSTTENPLWIEQKLKLYEEQELTMQVFCEPEANRLPTTSTFDRRGSDETSVVDNTYATIQHPARRNSVNTMLSMGPGDYATLGGSVLPLDKTSSHSQQIIEAALGFQGCTFQVPDGPADTTELLRARSELRMNKDGQPEFVSELM